MDNIDNDLKETIKTLTPEQLAELKVKNDELIRKANRIIDEVNNTLKK